ncbi:MAG: hypothetical protein AAGC46_05010 [Solirubrobacteraceae bacterium]|nr:hypothetical protein [Patulibacter sp.]
MKRSVRPGSRRAIVRAAVIAVAAAGLTAVPAAAASAKLTASLGASSVAAGSTTTLSGTVRPAAKRTVRLEVKTGKRWTVAATTVSSKKGRFTLTVPAKSTAAAGSLSVRANAPGKGRAKAVASRPVTLTVTANVFPPCCKTTAPSSTPTPAPVPAPTPAPGPAPVTTAASAKSSFRALYVLASDQTVDPAKAAAIANDIAVVDAWFGTQTDGHVVPRWVRDAAGAVPITVVTIPQPAASFATRPFNATRALLDAAAPTPSNQKTVAWFDVGSPDGCGVTGSGDTIVFESACDIHPSTADTWPFGATYLAAHEMTHNFGAVPACAPHQGNGGHVIDDPRDVLYAGAGARDWDHLMLDPGHDDYYDTGRADCPGIEGSPFWTATSDPLS